MGCHVNIMRVLVVERQTNHEHQSNLTHSFTGYKFIVKCYPKANRDNIVFFISAFTEVIL